jgi:hypothetical protein
MVNIHDAKEVYADVAEKLRARIQQEEQRISDMTESMTQRLIQINEI